MTEGMWNYVLSDMRKSDSTRIRFLSELRHSSDRRAVRAGTDYKRRI